MNQMSIEDLKALQAQADNEEKKAAHNRKAKSQKDDQQELMVDQVSAAE